MSSLAMFAGLVAACAAVEVGFRLPAALRERRKAAAELKAKDARELLLAVSRGHVSGIISGVRAAMGPMHPGCVDDVTAALARAGITEGAQIMALGALGSDTPSCTSVVDALKVEWCEPAETVGVIFRIAAHDRSDRG